MIARIPSQTLLAILVRGAALVALVVVTAQLWTRDLGMDERLVGSSRVVHEVDPGGAAARAGIAVGDVIVADPGGESHLVQRTEREMYAESYRLGKAMQSGRVPMVVRRGDEERHVTIVPDPDASMAATLRQLRRVGTELPVAFAFLGVALLLARRPSRSDRDERARIDVAAGCALLGASWVGAWPAPAWPLWLYPVTSVLETFACGAGIVLLARFAWSYPTRSRLVDHRGVRLAVVGAGLPCATFSMLNSLHVVAAPEGLRGNTVNIAFTGLLGVVTFAGLVWQRGRAVDLIARRQSTWLLGFCGVGIGVPLAVLLVPHYGLQLPAPTILRLLALAFPLLLPIGFAVVVTRFRLFSLDGVAVHAVAYAIAVVASLVVCLGVTLGIDAAFASRVGMGEAGRWLGMILALVLVVPLRHGVQVLLDRAFARDRAAFLSSCAELASRLAPLSDERRIEEEIRASLDAKTVSLLALDDVTVEEQVSRAGAMRVVDLRDATAVDAWRERGVEVLVAIPHGRVLALAFPEAASMGRAERDALTLVGRVVGAALALRAERARAEHERRHIAMELHDGIGATLTAARSMTRRLRGAAPEGTLDALDETLREGIGELRVSLAGLEPEEADWDAIVANLRRHVGDQCAAEGISMTLQSHGDGARRLSPSGRLAVLRVVQEAVSNAVKHAEARAVRVRMELNAGGLDVAVEDDGKGCEPRTNVGRGLGNMARRVERLGGKLRVDAVVPHGTRVAMLVPASALLFASTEAS